MIPPISRNVLLVAGAVLLLLVYLVIMRLFQKCPHCGALVRRARRGWIRCRRCGRQYHRSVRLR